jgi:hypothetical protein
LYRRRLEMSNPYEGDSIDSKTPGLIGTYAVLNPATGVGVLGAGLPGYAPLTQDQEKMYA